MSTEHKGVRMACEQCTWACVMTREDELPAGVNHMEEGVPWCPNCSIPMRPAGSVEAKNGTAVTVPPAAVADDVPIEQRLEVIRQAQTEVDAAKERLDRAKERAADLRKEYDGKVLTLGSIIRRLTQVPAPLPLFDEALKTVDGADAPPAGHVIAETAAQEFAAMRERLLALGFDTTVEVLDQLSIEDWQMVVAFVEARENGGTVAVPVFLMAPDGPYDDDQDDAAPPPLKARRKRASGPHEASA